MTAEETREYRRRLVDAAPPLTPSVRLRLAAVLRPDLPVGIRTDSPASPKAA